ncbi:ATP-binding protein [Salmonella enterica]|nr:ATP-binding protein [Salmonella enterica]
MSTFITINGLKKSNKIRNSTAINILNFLLNGHNSLKRHEIKSLETFEIERAKVESFLKYISQDFSFTEYMQFPVDAYKGEMLLIDFEVENYFDFKLVEMSSGQLAIIHQMSLISKAIKQLAEKGTKKILLMIDEGDAYLHLEWQRNYIFKINEFLNKVKNINNLSFLQLILATHSPLLATDIPKKFICPMDKADATSGFASPIHLLLNESFGTKTIGEFASQRINKTVKNIKENNISEKDLLVIKSIDNDILEREIMKLIPSSGDIK